MDDRRLLPVLAAALVLGLVACSSGPAAGVRCGNGRIDSGEECDRGKDNDDRTPGACRTDCTAAACGDGVPDPGEACDDGEANSDVQPGACRSTCLPPACGDGVVDPGEGCDDGEANGDEEPGGCRTDCLRASCGNGVVDPGEACDDGEANDDLSVDGCRTTCRRPHCGDGILGEGEECDDGPANSDRAADACRTTCVRARCGDGAVDGGEACDEGAGNADDVPDACRTACILPACGDGVVDLGEACDDGDPLGEDGCTRHCEPYLPESCLATSDGLRSAPLHDLRAVGIPEGTGFRVESTLEESGAYVPVERPACENVSGARPAFYAYPIPAAGDLVAELEMAPTFNSFGLLGVWRSCNAAPTSCAVDRQKTGRTLVIVPDVDPSQGIYFLQVNQASSEPAAFVLRVDVRPPLAAGDPCATDGSLGRCDPAGGQLACADPDGDGTGTCVPLLDAGAACDPAGRRDLCREPLVCRDGVCGPSCGDGVRQAWEACDDGNAIDDDSCSTACEPRVTGCAAPFDLNSAWDATARQAEWLDDTSRATNLLAGTCGAGPAPEAVATFLAPEAGRYHFQVETRGGTYWSPALSLLETCSPYGLAVACGIWTWPDLEVGLDLAAGQQIYAVVDGARLPPGTPGPEPAGPFTLTVAQELCGDGVIQGTEACDDGNLSSGDRCLPDCTVPGDDCSVPYPLPSASGGLVEWRGSAESLAADGLLSCVGSSPRDAVASFTAPAAGRYSFLVRDGGWALALVSGACIGGTSLGCATRGVSDFVALEATLAAGETVWVVVGAHAEFTLEVRPLVCGDGLRVRPEECDDGNTAPGDGCDGSCRLEPLAEVEPNDLRPQAQHVPLATTVVGSLAANDRDYFTVDLAAGTFYDVLPSLGAPGACASGVPDFWLYGPSAELLEAWPGPSDCDPLSFVAPVSGRYFLRIDGAVAPAYFFVVRAR